ncbi:hypothetical protein DUNSADRAFT_295 [Dunaliella salina]|uniref:Uncharacterized protein n=1 Tax=Dunaliella salina TaxID=3046 RepID=A0ABQ7GYF7_DUNSA|nr:hypothetical protein DUNSADRAFT_295 [Dunaliella salina]|eukprot:KAF5839639.1 hypothetical protein DUNSADRAFT_295 [Dunaliella salina]
MQEEDDERAATEYLNNRDHDGAVCCLGCGAVVSIGLQEFIDIYTGVAAMVGFSPTIVILEAFCTAPLCLRAIYPRCCAPLPLLLRLALPTPHIPVIALHILTLILRMIPLPPFGARPLMHLDRGRLNIEEIWRMSIY